MADMLLKQTEEWFTRNRHEIIHCPHQPGNLIITRHACMKRRDRADRENLTDLMTGDISTYIFKKGLALCKDCRVGAHRPTVRHQVASTSDNRVSA